jgi:hypothetical protein
MSAFVALSLGLVGITAWFLRGAQAGPSPSGALAATRRPPTTVGAAVQDAVLAVCDLVVVPVTSHPFTRAQLVPVLVAVVFVVLLETVTPNDVVLVQIDAVLVIHSSSSGGGGIIGTPFGPMLLNVRRLMLQVGRMVDLRYLRPRWKNTSKEPARRKFNTRGWSSM